MKNPRYLSGLTLCLTTALGCTGAPGDDTQPTGDSPGDTATAFLAFDVTPAVDMPTVMVVTGTSELPLNTWLEVSDDEGATWTTPALTTEGEEHLHLLRGLRQDSDYGIRLLGSDGETVHSSATRSVHTGTFDPAPPLVQVEVLDPDTATDQLTVVTVFQDAASAPHPAILDSQGRYLWYSASFETLNTRLSADRSGITVHRGANGADDDGMLDLVGFDGTRLRSTAVRGSHMTYVEPEPGIYATFGWSVGTLPEEDRRYAVDTLVEVGIDGEQRTLWSPVNEPGILLGEAWTESTYPDDPEREDWTHFNSLAYDADRHLYIVVSAVLNAVFAVNRSDGTLAWTLEADGGDFALDDKATLIDRPHSAQLVEGGVLIFNRGPMEGCSEAVEIALDEHAMQATVRWRHVSAECYSVKWMGQAECHALGATSITWATAGVMDQLDSDGSLTRRLTLQSGGVLGFGEMADSLYPSKPDAGEP